MTEDLTGWHPDPTGRHEHRYFDGSSWTDHVSDGGNLSTDPVAAQAEAARPAEASRVDLPAITPELLAGLSGAGPGAGTAPQPAPTPAAAPAAHAPAPTPAAAPDPTVAQPAPVSRSDDDAFDQDAAKAALQVPTDRPPLVGALLSVVFPGSGHLFLGAKKEVGYGLMAVTLVAAYLAYDPVGPWFLGYAILVAAALYALYDLRPAIEPAMNANGGGLDALGSVGSGWAWRLAGAGGIVLAISLLILPAYHLIGSATAFESWSLIDILGFVIGILAIVAAAIALGVLAGKSMPAVLPTVLAVGGLATWLLIEFRTFFPGHDVGLASDLGRGPGVLLSGVAALTIAFGAAAALKSRD